MLEIRTRRIDPEHLRRAERQIETGKVRALKAYLGYLPFGPDHPNYVPYIEMAQRHRLPFVFHTGDTYSTVAKLKYAHPLGVDEVAVDHPDVRFVLAHCGNPWLIDAAEVVYKNPNVWADLSGLVIADETTFSSVEHKDALADVAAVVRRAFRYAERPNRFVFGTGQPLRIPENGGAKLDLLDLEPGARAAIESENASLLRSGTQGK